MSITTYAELQTAVGAWLHKATGTDIATARVQEFIALAEDYLAQDVRIREMEATDDITISAQTAALPTGYVGTRRFYLSGDPNSKLEYLPPLDFWGRYLATQSGKPVAFTIEGDSLVFGPAPDATYTGKLLFWQRFTAFADDADTNALLTKARGLYLYRSLVEACVYLQNDGGALRYATLYDDLKATLEQANILDRFPVGTAVKSDVSGP